MPAFCARHKRLIALLALLILAVGVTSQVEASDGLRGDRCVVAEDEHIVEDFFFICRVLEVHGTIEGDLLGIASNVTITPEAVVTGDIWVVGGRVDIQGTVGDDVHFIGVSVSIAEQTRFTNPRTDLMSIALNTTVAKRATVPGDLLVYGYQAQVDGTIGGDIDFSGETLIINGAVEGRIDASVGDARRSTDIPDLPFYDVSFSNPGLLIAAGAQIGSDLSYEAPTAAEIPSGVVGGSTSFTQIVSQPDIIHAEQPEAAARIMKSYAVSAVRDLITLLIIGAAGLRVVPNFVMQPAQNVRRRMIPTIGWGLVTFMLSFPLAVILILISLIALLLLIAIGLTELSIVSAVGLFAVNLALIGGFWFMLLFMGRVVVSFAVGQLIYRYVLRLQQPGTYKRWIITLALGGVIFVLVTNMPVPAAGVTIELIAALAGIGAIVMYLRSLVYASQITSEENRTVPAMVSANEVRLPPVEQEREVPLGMENLPPGFTGFGDD
jgi:cytoskeletal protein CcmA (bactofilin family)